MSLLDRPESDPVLSQISSALASGHAAAAVIATEAHGSMRYDLPLDADVSVEASYEGERTAAISLIEVLDRAARGRLPVALAARPGNSMMTIAVVVFKTKSGVLLAQLCEFRGVVSAPLSEWELPKERVAAGTRGTLGDRVTRAIQRTTIEEAKGRLDEAKRLSGTNVRDLVASASAKVLLSDDRWPPLLTWCIAEATKQGQRRFLASSPIWRGIDGMDQSRRRAAIFGAVTRAFEEEAGTVRHESRGDDVRVEPMGLEPASMTTAETDALLEVVELHDFIARAIARAKLTDRQREVLDLYYLAGRTDPEIADQLRIAVSTVTNTRLNTLKKLRAIA